MSKLRIVFLLQKSSRRLAYLLILTALASTISAAAENSELRRGPRIEWVALSDADHDASAAAAAEYDPRVYPPPVAPVYAPPAASVPEALGRIAQLKQRFGGSRLLATGGISPLEGGAGGGIVPWALIAGLGDRDQIGGSAYYTQVNPSDFSLHATGAALGVFNRVELSAARLDFGLGTTVPDHSIGMDVVGVKARIWGDAVYDQDSWLPQFAVGLEHKHNKDFDLVPQLLGARRADDEDYYLAATKVWLDAVLGCNLVTDFTLRATRANQFGILGFGGDLSDRYKLTPEASVGLFLDDHWLIGGEYRAKPHNLSVFKEKDAQDLFLIWFPVKRLALTGAWSWLGPIADKPNQRALYVSAQLGF